jgi:hypothetical protein
MISSQFGDLPGITTARETQEVAFSWGRRENLIIFPGTIDGATRDAGNTPTDELRPGLVLGQITSSGLFTAYSATATDGSQVAIGINMVGLKMIDMFTGANQTKTNGIVVAGPVQGSKLFGLDAKARADMHPRFIFDDNIAGNRDYFDLREVVKTTDYTVKVADNDTTFTTLGAGANVTFTLPTIAPGLVFYFLDLVDFNMAVTSAEGGNIVWNGSAANSTLTFQTSSHKIGGYLKVYSNNAGTLWYVEQLSPNTVTPS